MLNIVLYEPEIPANTGNIMRTCAAFNMKLHLIEPLGFYMDEAHLRRAGMYYREHIDYILYHDWSEFAKKNTGSMYYVTRYGNKAPCDFDYAEDVKEGKDIYLVFGKESTGIPKELLYENLDRCMRIPMVPDARTLNLSNCVAIVSYKVIERLGFPGLSLTEVQKGADFLEEVHNHRQK
jgi:tRNA (cytidine/uridine-2'-O-)-methyltransferase